jgi:DNA-binding transcriptional ArsR family regulator
MEKQAVISVLAALAQETRLDVFRLLVQAGSEGMPAGAIGEVLGVPAATLSFHLKELKSCGALECRREGRSLIYSPDFQVMNGLLSFLTENCCAGAGCAPAGPSLES